MEFRETPARILHNQGKCNHMLRENIPTFNAIMNSVSLALLLIGFQLVRRRRLLAHRNVMLAAVFTSSLFLAGYLTYHFSGESKRYTGDWTFVYYPILVTHVILAAYVPIGVGVLLYRAFRGELQQHRRLARVTLPIWVYVSLTGILVYYFVHVSR